MLIGHQHVIMDDHLPLDNDGRCCCSFPMPSSLTVLASRSIDDAISSHDSLLNAVVVVVVDGVGSSLRSGLRTCWVDMTSCRSYLNVSVQVIHMLRVTHTLVLDVCGTWVVIVGDDNGGISGLCIGICGVSVV